MSQLRRLVDAPGNGELRELLEAGLSDAPPYELLASVHSALAAGCVIPIPVVLALPAGAVALKGGSASLPLPHLFAWVAKPLLVGILSGSVVCGAAAVVNDRARPRTESVSMLPTQSLEHARSTSRSARSVPGGLVVPVLESEASTTSFPDLEPALPDGARASSEVHKPKPNPDSVHASTFRPAAASAQRSSVETASKHINRGEASPSVVVNEAANPSEESRRPASLQQGTLRAEIDQLDRARSALAAGDSDAARSALDAYDAQPRQGVLAREALLLRIDVANRRGQVNLVRLLAEQYLTRFTSDPHAGHMRELLRATSNR